MSSRKYTYNLLKGLICLGLILCFGKAQAQPGNPDFNLRASTYFEVDMRSIALVDIETSTGSKNFSLEIPIIDEAGSGLVTAPETETSLWLNYSCAVRDVGSRSIQVNISNGTVPDNFTLSVTVSNASGASSGGTLGSPVGGATILTSSATTVVTGIQGAFTGHGANNGHQLTYSLVYSGSGADFATVFAASEVITVLYTIIDD
jgi:hypothetical protein